MHLIRKRVCTKNQCQSSLTFVNNTFLVNGQEKELLFSVKRSDGRYSIMRVNGDPQVYLPVLQAGGDLDITSIDGNGQIAFKTLAVHYRYVCFAIYTCVYKCCIATLHVSVIIMFSVRLD